jgi:hypothetical protein
MGVPGEPLYSLLMAAVFSRHDEALQWAGAELQQAYGPIALASDDYAFHHTRYYEASMGAGLRKRLLVFEPFVAPDCLPEIKRQTISLESQLADSRRFAEERPLNIDPGLLQLGKLLLASTKDQMQRVYLRDGIFAEITLRYTAGSFEPWPWTYADYREPAVIDFLNRSRVYLYDRIAALRHVES